MDKENAPDTHMRSLDGVKRGLRFSSPMQPSERCGAFAGALTPEDEEDGSVDAAGKMFTMSFSPPPGKKSETTTTMKREPLGERRVSFVAGTQDGGHGVKRRATPHAKKKEDEDDEDASRRRAERYSAMAYSALSKCESPAPSKLLPQREALTPRDADAREYKRHVAALRLQALLHRRRAVRAFTKTARLAREHRVVHHQSAVSSLTDGETDMTDTTVKNSARGLREALQAAAMEKRNLEAKLAAAMEDLDQQRRLSLESFDDEKFAEEREVLELRASLAEEKVRALQLDLEKAVADHEVTMEAAVEAARAQYEGDLTKYETELAALRSTTEVQEVFLTEARKMAVDAEDRARAACAAAAAAHATLTLTTRALDRDRAQWDATRRVLHNQVVELRGNIRTFVRVRPALDTASPPIITSNPAARASNATTGDIVEVPEVVSAGGPPRQRRTFQFAVDRVFPPTTDQADVFDAVKPFVQSAIDGFQVCVFAYGQTGSGKTWTTVGDDTPQGRGILGRALDLFFDEINDLQASRGWTFDGDTVVIQAYEIYLDKVYDLLDKKQQQHHHTSGPVPTQTTTTTQGTTQQEQKKKHRRYSTMFPGGAPGGGGNAPAKAATKRRMSMMMPPVKEHQSTNDVSGDRSKKALDVMANGNGDVTVQGLTEVGAATAEEAAEILANATRRRRTSATKSNAASSRSHCVISLSFHGTHPSFGTRRGKFNLVDLAGSERLKTSGSSDDPALLREAQHINTSLSALGNTIAALARNSTSGKKPDHVPFRDSKLTFLLQPSLGGDGGKTLAIFNVALEQKHHRESLATLNFAKKVSKCIVGNANPHQHTTK